MAETVVVIAEHLEGRIKPVTYELIAFAEALRREKPLKIAAVILGSDPDDLARELAHVGGLEVTAVQVPELSAYNAEVYKTVLADFFSESQAACICVAHTSQGLDFAPALAVKLKAACITGVEKILKIENRICFARPLYGGKVSAHVCPEAETAVVTIQPGAFNREKKDPTSEGSVSFKSMPCRPQKSRLLGLKQSEVDTAGITEAKVIVAAGRGIGDRDNLDLIHQLAALFTKSAVAGSRIVCDLGWLQYRCQVGVTGATVSPQLYMACGISGAVQHLSGMRGSEFIVAINKDPAAAIFQIADVVIVEDLTTFIPVFIEAYKRK